MDKALITGGSSGIGLELARVMAQNGHDLVLSARDKKALDKAAKHLMKEYSVNVTVYVSDLSKSGSAAELYKQTKHEKIGILVNNAGVGNVEDFFEGDLTRNQSMAHLNMVSLMELCHLFGKDFKKQGSGRILNTASIVAFFPGPAQPVYYATKSFVRSLSRALAYNLRDSGVTVTALHPGVTKTNFFTEANAPKITTGASAESVARLGYKAMMKGKIEVTHGLWNKFLTNVFVRITPYRSQPAIVDRSSDV